VEFDCRSLYPGLSAEDTAEEVAAYFNGISNEFEPLHVNDIPSTYKKTLPRFEPYQVATRLRAFKKPNSRVKTSSLN
jgi:hypothetical protein